jgi:hypothetical protein
MAPSYVCVPVVVTLPPFKVVAPCTVKLWLPDTAPSNVTAEAVSVVLAPNATVLL